MNYLFRPIAVGVSALDSCECYDDSRYCKILCGVKCDQVCAGYCGTLSCTGCQVPISGGGHSTIPIKVK